MILRFIPRIISLLLGLQFIQFGGVFGQQIQHHLYFKVAHVVLLLEGSELLVEPHHVLHIPLPGGVHPNAVRKAQLLVAQRQGYLPEVIEILGDHRMSNVASALAHGNRLGLELLVEKRHSK